MKFLSISARSRFLGSPVRFCATFYAVVWITIILAHYPSHVDAGRSASNGRTQPGQAFYEAAYTTQTNDPTVGTEDAYVETARKMAELFGVKDSVQRFVRDYKLERKRILDVGAGSGYLQDVVSDYIGLDISGSARRYFHKPFIQGSATDLPFGEDSFDAIWTVWVLEHVPQPEHALVEMRRVLKNDGLLYLDPAWRCAPWAADGYAVRAFRDLSLKGKLVKASLPLRTSPLFQISYIYPIRFIRTITTRVTGGQSHFRYTPLEPNYEKYWVPDSDAVNSMDRFEAILWFKSRGDRCLNCGTAAEEFLRLDGPLIIQVRKDGGM
jgi:SAM-dependent methyltransferase